MKCVVAEGKMQGYRVLESKGPAQPRPAPRCRPFSLPSTFPIRSRGPTLLRCDVLVKPPPGREVHSGPHRLQGLYLHSCSINSAIELPSEPLVVGARRPQISPLVPMSPVVTGRSRQPQPIELPPGSGPALVAVVQSALRSADHVRVPSSASIPLSTGRAAGRGF